MSIYTKPLSLQPLIFSKKDFHVFTPNRRRNNMLISASTHSFSLNCNVITNICPRSRRNCFKPHFSKDWSAGAGSQSPIRKRNVVEHVCLLKAKEGLSDEEEKDMLDYLYTLQYQMGGIVAISLGSISNQNPDGYTHAVYMRFQRKEDLAKFYGNSSYLGVLREHVMPHCHELISVDYNCEVEDDILPIFRKGEEFNYGIEFVLLISVVEGAVVGCIVDALDAFINLTLEYPSLIAQATQGSNFNSSSSEYTHAAVIRFRSSEAFKMFVGSPSYRELWMSKFEPITKKSLTVQFSIEPVGTEIM